MRIHAKKSAMVMALSKDTVYGLQILPFEGSSFDNLVKEQNFDWLIFRYSTIEQLSAFVQFLRFFLMIPQACLFDQGLQVGKNRLGQPAEVISALKNRNHSSIAMFLGQVPNQLSKIKKIFIDQLEMAERITLS